MRACRVGSHTRATWFTARARSFAARTQHARSPHLQRPHALASPQAPACFELSNWLGEEIAAFAASPPPRLPPLLVSAKTLAEKQRGALITADYHSVARSAGVHIGALEAEAATQGITLEEHLRATGQYPLMDPKGDSRAAASD